MLQLLCRYLGVFCNSHHNYAQHIPQKLQAVSLSSREAYSNSHDRRGAWVSNLTSSLITRILLINAGPPISESTAKLVPSNFGETSWKETLGRRLISSAKTEIEVADVSQCSMELLYLTIFFVTTSKIIFHKLTDWSHYRMVGSEPLLRELAYHQIHRSRDMLSLPSRQVTTRFKGVTVC